MEPFIRAGIATFRQRRIRTSPGDKVEALNECVARYRRMRVDGNPKAPRWVVLIDSDEYFWAGDLVSTLSDVIMMYSSTCCLQVSVVFNILVRIHVSKLGILLSLPVLYILPVSPVSRQYQDIASICISLLPASRRGSREHSLARAHDVLVDVLPSGVVCNILVKMYVSILVKISSQPVSCILPVFPVSRQQQDIASICISPVPVSRRGSREHSLGRAHDVLVDVLPSGVCNTLFKTYVSILAKISSQPVLCTLPVFPLSHQYRDIASTGISPGISWALSRTCS